MTSPIRTTMVYALVSGFLVVPVIASAWEGASSDDTDPGGSGGTFAAPITYSWTSPRYPDRTRL